MKFRVIRLLFGLLLAWPAAWSMPRASAVADNVLIYQLQTGGSGSGTASQELVLLYNHSLADVDVSNWCIKYSSATNNSGFSVCITSPDNTELWLTAGGIVSFATNEFVSANPGFAPDVMMGGGLASSGGHLRLHNNLDAEIDKVGWGGAVNPEGIAATAHTAGSVLSRDLEALLPDTDNNAVDFTSKPAANPITSGLYEVEVVIDLCPNIDEVQTEIPNGYLSDEAGDCHEDLCPNLDELQTVLPVGYFLDIDGECELLPLEDRVLFVTELLPNAPSYDTGLEFIEIYNPNDEAIDLAGYRLQVGPGFTKEYEFAEGTIKPGQYLTFSDSVTGIVLPNSNGVSVRLLAPAGNTVSESAVYENADDDVSWALVDDVWIFTNQVTPGAANKPYVQPAVDEEVGVTSVLAPCPAGKYRNPETNRCRTIETAVSGLSPCAEDEYRNPETNRCRQVATASASLAPCREGQERNPETNRCRNINVLGVSSESDLAAIEDVAVETTSGQLNWPVIIAAITATGGYMVYEWRNELRQRLLLARLRR